MQVIKLSQREDREAWLEARRGLITGSKAKGLKPLSRGTDRTPAGFWELLAENLSIAKDGEPERDRGLRLEQEALLKTQEVYGLDLNLDCGMWVSDTNPNIAVSPDSAENTKKPKYAAEAKCLDSKNHLKILVHDRRASKLEDYHPVDSLRLDSKIDFTSQVVQYFIVNESLQKLYFTLYDDRMAYENLVHHVIEIDRKHVANLVDEQLMQQLATLNEVKDMIKEITNG